MAVVSLWTPLQFPRIRERWFSLPNILFLWPVPVDHGAHRVHGVALARTRPRHPAVLRRDRAVHARLIGARDLGLPYLVPPAMTIWDAAAAPASQIFMLLGTLPLLPIILMYTGFVYYLFRGKVREGEAYH